MPDLDLTEITATRGTAARLAAELRTVEVALERARRNGETAAARGDRARAERSRAEALRLEREQEALAGRRAATAARLRELSEALAATTPPPDAIASLTGEVPVLMLPARLETRFFDGGDTLKIRVFPDQVHVTAHDAAATADEVAALTWYWGHRWPDLQSQDLAEAAWEGLTSRLRPGRAAFLVREYAPVDQNARSPRLPEIPQRPADGVTPGTAGLLPDRWCAIGYRRSGEGAHTAVFTVWGSAVPDTLAAGPGIGRGPADATDEALAWLDDPAAAERVGMLLTVRQRDCARGFRLRDGVDRLVVLGVDWTRTPDEAAAAVDRHFAAHAGQGRMAFVPQGAPTNSTGTTRSAFTTDPAAVRGVLAPHRPLPDQPDAAGALLAAALGLDPEPLRRLPGADLREQAWQGALLESLWSATGGYFLTEMLDPLADDPALERALRRHVADALRPGGPLPTVRIAAQPYGVLPILPRDALRPARQARAQREVQRISAAMRRLAEPLVDRVPRLAQVSSRQDVDAVLLALLQRTPVAWSLTFRNLVGHERQALGGYWAKLAAFQRSVTAVLLAELGAKQVPMLADLTHDPTDHPLTVPMVLRTEPDGTAGTGYLAEIAELLTRGDGRLILDGRQDASALLEALLACAAVREIDRAAKASVAARLDTVALAEPLRDYVIRLADRVPTTVRVEDVGPASGDPAGAAPRTPEEFSRMVIPGLTGTATVAQRVAADFRARVSDLPALLDTPDDPVHDLAGLTSALTTLQEAPADQLEWAFRSVLDAYATRLDAWISSVATARLHEQRAARPNGLHIGGWGLVEDLQPNRGPAARSLGYVHTPSLGQAASTAVLRSARAAHRDAEGRVFDLDLSSQRVRHALTILAGVAQGQRLAALLGYRFERALHESGNGSPAQWIPALRRRFPLRSDRPETPDAGPTAPAWDSGGTDQPVESVAARDVVDGVALLERYERDGAALWASAGIAAGDRAAVDGAARFVADLADAVSDVLVAEAVHQATSGNLERSGAALAAHDQQGPPPDPEFVRTPRAGHAVAHRVGIWLSATDVAAAPGWPTDLRTIAEPRLDRWLGLLLGDPHRWSVRGRLQRAAAPGQPLPALVELGSAGPADLGIGALSLTLAARRPGPGQPSALEALLQEHLLAQHSGLAVAESDQLVLDADDLAGLLDLAGWAADVAGARPLQPADLTAHDNVVAPAAAMAGAVDPAEALDRATALTAAVTQRLADLQQARGAHAAAASPATAAAVAAALRPLQALPAVSAAAGVRDADPGVLATAVSGAAAAALATAAALPGSSPAGEDPHVARARSVVQALLGPDQPFLPVITPADPLAAAASLADRDALLGADPTAAIAWLHRMALVRPQLDGLAALLTETEARGTEVADDLRLVQAPHRPGRPWVALPFGAAGPPEPGTVAVLLHAPAGMDPQSGGAGLIVDDWTETIPATHDTTGVTFHFDAPGARAPQTMLLAVHPDPARTWSLQDLAGCVNEAADLARLRTLSSKELAPFSTFLPALFLPDGYTRDTPGVRIMELVAHLERLGTGGLVLDHVLGKGGTGHA